jgi:hypothetical protein
MSVAAGKPSIRDYDRKRMRRIALAMWQGVLLELRDEEGRVFMPSGEVLDAMAMLGGIMLASWPDAQVPSRLRARCEEHARDLAQRTREAMANPGARELFDVVLTDPAEAAH